MSGMDDDYQYEYSDDESTPESNDSMRNDSSNGSGGFGGVEQEDISARKRRQYKVFNGEALRERQTEAVTQVTSILGISEEDAGRLLRHYKWDPNRVNEEWWGDMDSVRRKIGLLDKEPSISAPQRKSAKAQCSICFEDYKRSQMQSAGCGHLFCNDCWKGYISAAIQGGHPVLGLRCPHPQCKIAVPAGVIQDICSEEESQRYDMFALESFVVDNEKFTFCPGPNCNNAVERLSDLSGEALDVYCPCGTTFCFTCKEEAHRPVDCDTIKKWLIKNSAESENLNWIIANTKPCPKCKRAIEKNQGCMHMTCSQCRHEFCWLCLQDWRSHNENTGGFYNCNRYEAARNQGQINEEEQKREHAKQALERYMHYYERWTENDKARKTAAAKSTTIQARDLEIYSQKFGYPTSELRYIVDACLQVVECRRMLKWTYAYGFYNFDDSAQRDLEEKDLKQQKEFFEFNQGQAEAQLNRLHQMVEEDLPKFNSEQHPKTKEEWDKFRADLISVTDLTKKYFTTLIEELEKGMANMLNAYERPRIGQDPSAENNQLQEPDIIEEENNDEGESSKAKGKKGGKGKAKKALGGIKTRANKNKADESGSDGLVMLDPEDEEAVGFWQCRSCTFANQDLDATECEVCQAERVFSDV